MRLVFLWGYGRWTADFLFNYAQPPNGENFYPSRLRKSYFAIFLVKMMG